MPQLYTLEEARQIFADKGIEFTPAVAAEMRGRGMLAENPLKAMEGLGAESPATGRDPRFANPDAIPVNPIGGQERYDPDHPASRFMNTAMDHVLKFAEMPPNPAGPPDTAWEKLATGAGHAVGYGTAFAGMSPGTSRLAGAIMRGMQGTKYAPLAPVLGNAVSGGAGLGAYEAMAPGTPMQRAERFAGGANMGVGFGAAGGLPIVGPALRHPAGKYPANAAMMTGLEVAHGKPLGDAILEGGTMGAMMPLLHGGKSEPGRLQKTPAEMEAPKFVEKPAPKDKFQYIEGEPRSKPVVDYLNDKIPLEEMTAQYKEAGLDKPSGQIVGFIKSGKAQNIGANQTVGRHRRIREMGGNVFNNPLSKATIRQFELWDRAKHKMEGEMKADFLNVLEKSGFKEGDPDFGVLAEYMRTYEKSPLDAEMLLGEAKNPERIKQAAPEFRAELGKQWRVQNDMELAAGNEAGFPHKEGYWPHIGKSYGWGDPLKAIKQRTEPVEPGSLDPDPKARAWTAREMEQTLAVKDAELDPFVFMDRVISDMGHKVAHTGAISAGKAVADALDAGGLKKTARGMRTITEASYNNKRYGLAGSEISSLQSTRGGQAELAMARFTKQRFNTAKYTMAVPFVVLRQWGSLGLLNAHGEITPNMWAKALAKSALPASGVKYRDSYTGWVKNLEYGHLSREGAMGDVTSTGSLRPKTGIRKAPDAIRAGSEWMVNRNENWTGRVSVEMADLIADKINMPEGDRAAFRSEVAGLTQSYYDAMNRGEMLNSPNLNLAFPAQSFGLESINVIYRDIITNKTLTKTQKAKRLSGLLSFVALQQLLNQYVTSYKDDPKDIALDTAKSMGTSMVPWVPQMTGIAGFGKGKPYPVTAKEDFFGTDEKKGVVGYLKDGDFTSAIGEFAKNWLRLGAQADRAIDTDRRIKEGKLTEDSRVKGSLFGWYTTPEGKAYLRDIKQYGEEEDDAPTWRPQGKRRGSSRRSSKRGR